MNGRADYIHACVKFEARTVSASSNYKLWFNSKIVAVRIASIEQRFGKSENTDIFSVCRLPLVLFMTIQWA